MERVNRIDLKLLRYFLAVADELHFGRAALRLNMSQPPLSLHIKELEALLGTPLFIRHSRSVALTHAGAVLQEEARRLLGSVDQALARVEQIGRGEAGRIELGIVGTALWGQMRGRMHQFLQDNPNVEVVFREESPGKQVDLVQQNLLDAGIWRMATQLPSRLTAKKIHDASFLLALPEHHPLTKRDLIPLALLRDDYFVTLHPVHSDWTFLQQYCQQAGFRPLIVREVLEPQTVLAMISMGLGVSLMADSYAQMQWPGVVFRPLAEKLPADLYLVFDASRVSPAVGRLVQALC